MAMPPSTARVLGFGEFFGSPELHRVVPGFSLARLTAMPSPAQVPEHMHAHAHLILVLEGVYETSARGADRRAGHRMLIYNPPGTRHRDTFSQGLGEFFSISISRQRLLAIARRVALPARPLALASCGSLQRAERAALALESRRSSAARIAELVEEVIGSLAPHGDDPTRRPPNWLLDVRRMLHDRYDEPWTIPALAAASRVHPVHVIRAFRRAFGRTPREFLRERRLGAAMSLLRSSDLPIADIALRVGFADQAHLTRSFTRGFGVPPGGYRRLERLNGRFIPDKTRPGEDD